MIETKELKGKISSDNKIQGGNTVISGPQGKDGLSAYEVAVKNGYIGTEEEWLINLKGEKGDQGQQGIQGEKGEQGEQGIQGIQGVPGKDFSIYKTYPSIAEMEADKDNVEEGNFVMIASNVEDVDNSKLYVKGSTDFVYLTDLSGANGMKGEQGPQGIQGEQGIQGPKGDQGEVSLEQLNILQAKTIKCLQEIETPTPVNGTSIDINDSAEAKISELKISGNSKQETRSGKNKFIPLPTGSNSGVAITLNMDGTYNLEGTAVNNSENINYIDIEKSGIKEGLTYILSATKDLPEGVLVRAEIYNGKTWVRQFVPSISSTNKTSTGIANFTNATRIRFLVLINSGITVNIKNIGFQLEEGTIATEYEQYGVMPSPDYPSEVECCGDNVNIFDGEVEEGNIDTSTGQNAVAANAWRSKNYINVKDTSVSISVKDLKFSGTVGRLYYYKNDNTYISNILINTLPFTTKLPSETAKVRFFILNSVTDINSKIKIENGIVTEYSKTGQGCINEVIDNGLETTDTNYKSQTYTIPTQQPMRSVGDYRDTFIKVNGKWFERHYIARKIFDGTEDWKELSDKITHYLAFEDIISKKDIIVSNCFIVGTESKEGVMGQGKNDNNIYFVTKYSSLETYKAWLQARYNAGKPVYVDYVSVTPLDIECTEEQSTILFDIEQNAKTYDKVTHIYSTDEVSPNVEVTYKKDIETLFSNTLVS